MHVRPFALTSALGLALSALLPLPPAQAAEAAASPLSFGVNAGTDGLSAELTYEFGKTFDLRGVASYFQLSHGVNTSDVSYDGHFRPETFDLLADIYPFVSAFRITAGGVLDRNLVTLKATPSQATTIGNQVYQPAQLGEIDGRVTFRDVAPYAGLGVTTNHDHRGWGFTADLGVMFSGAPRVALSATGPFASDPTFQSNLAIEQTRVASKIDWLRYYPVAKIGIAYHF